jgi:hypothetical protein
MSAGQPGPGAKHLEIGGLVRTPAGNVSIPGVVVPLPPPPGPLPIGDELRRVVAAVEDAIGVRDDPAPVVVGDVPRLPIGGTETHR